MAPRLTRGIRLWIGVGAMVASAAVWIAIATGHAPGAGLKPSLTVSADGKQPVLLASGLEPSANTLGTTEAESRAPQPAGSIVSMEGGLASINLGSLDGLSKGSELPVVRAGATVGKLKTIAVERDRARCAVEAGESLRAGDEVRVGNMEHYGMLLEQADARFQRGDAAGAENLAEQAASWGAAAQVPAVSLAVAWNRLAVLRMLRGEYDQAEAPLNRAATSAPESDLAHGQSLNNRGVLAEIRGDRKRAESLYAAALQVFPNDERRAVEKNLARVRTAR